MLTLYLIFWDLVMLIKVMLIKQKECMSYTECKVILKEKSEPLGSQDICLSSGKWSNLEQLKKLKIKIFLLSIARKNKIYFQYPIKKFNVFISIAIGLLKKNEILFSNSTVIFMCYIIISSILEQSLFLIFRKIFITFTIISTLFTFFFFRKF